MQQIGNCRDCKFFNKVPDETFGECDLAYHSPPQGPIKPKPETKFYACDPANWEATLKVHPDFGCLEFKAI